MTVVILILPSAKSFNRMRVTPDNVRCMFFATCSAFCFVTLSMDRVVWVLDICLYVKSYGFI